MEKDDEKISKEPFTDALKDASEPPPVDDRRGLLLDMIEGEQGHISPDAPASMQSKRRKRVMAKRGPHVV